jgi:hypothetical protein
MIESAGIVAVNFQNRIIVNLQRRVVRPNTSILALNSTNCHIRCTSWKIYPSRLAALFGKLSSIGSLRKKCEVPSVPILSMQ